MSSRGQSTGQQMWKPEEEALQSVNYILGFCIPFPMLWYLFYVIRSMLHPSVMNDFTYLILKGCSSQSCSKSC